MEEQVWRVAAAAAASAAPACGTPHPPRLPAITAPAPAAAAGAVQRTSRSSPGICSYQVYEIRFAGPVGAPGVASDDESPQAWQTVSGVWRGGNSHPLCPGIETGAGSNVTSTSTKCCCHQGEGLACQGADQWKHKPACCPSCVHRPQIRTKPSWTLTVDKSEEESQDRQENKKRKNKLGEGGYKQVYIGQLSGGFLLEDAHSHVECAANFWTGKVADPNDPKKQLPSRLGRWKKDTEDTSCWLDRESIMEVFAMFHLTRAAARRCTCGHKPLLPGSDGWVDNTQGEPAFCTLHPPPIAELYGVIVEGEPSSTPLRVVGFVSRLCSGLPVAVSQDQSAQSNARTLWQQLQYCVEQSSPYAPPLADEWFRVNTRIWSLKERRNFCSSLVTSVYALAPDDAANCVSCGTQWTSKHDVCSCDSSCSNQVVWKFIHNDITPANIGLHVVDGQVFVLLLDLGKALSLVQETDSSSTWFRSVDNNTFGATTIYSHFERLKKHVHRILYSKGLIDEAKMLDDGETKAPAEKLTLESAHDAYNLFLCLLHVINLWCMPRFSIWTGMNGRRWCDQEQIWSTLSEHWLRCARKAGHGFGDCQKLLFTDGVLSSDVKRYLQCGFDTLSSNSHRCSCPRLHQSDVVKAAEEGIRIIDDELCHKAQYPFTVLGIHKMLYERVLLLKNKSKAVLVYGWGGAGKSCTALWLMNQLAGVAMPEHAVKYVYLQLACTGKSAQAIQGQVIEAAGQKPSDDLDDRKRQYLNVLRSHQGLILLDNVGTLKPFSPDSDNQDADWCNALLELLPPVADDSAWMSCPRFIITGRRKPEYDEHRPHVKTRFHVEDLRTLMQSDKGKEQLPSLLRNSIQAQYRPPSTNRAARCEPAAGNPAMLEEAELDLFSFVSDDESEDEKDADVANEDDAPRTAVTAGDDASSTEIPVTAPTVSDEEAGELCRLAGYLPLTIKLIAARLCQPGQHPPDLIQQLSASPAAVLELEYPDQDKLSYKEGLGEVAAVFLSTLCHMNQRWKSYDSFVLLRKLAVVPDSVTQPEVRALCISAKFKDDRGVNGRTLQKLLKRLHQYGLIEIAKREGTISLHDTVRSAAVVFWDKLVEHESWPECKNESDRLSAPWAGDNSLQFCEQWGISSMDVLNGTSGDVHTDQSGLECDASTDPLSKLETHPGMLIVLHAELVLADLVNNVLEECEDITVQNRHRMEKLLPRLNAVMEWMEKVVSQLHSFSPTYIDLHKSIINAHDNIVMHSSLARMQTFLQLTNSYKCFPDYHQADILNSMGLVAQDQGQSDEAMKLLNESLVIWRRLKIRKGIAGVLNNMGVVAEAQGQYDEAMKLHNESLVIDKELNNGSGIAKTLHNMGSVAKAQGQYDEAMKLYNESLVIKKELNDRSGEATTSQNMGVVARAQGHYDEAMKLYNESLVIYKELNDRSRIAGILHNMGVVARVQGQSDEAMKWFNESLVIYKELNNRSGIAGTLHNMGAVARAQGQYDEAMERFNEALVIFEELNNRSEIADTLDNMGQVAYAQGQFDEAMKLYNESLVINKELNNRSGEADTLNNMGGVAKAQGQYDEAMKLYNESLVIKKQLNNRSGIADTLNNMGIVFKQQRLFSDAFACFRESGEVYVSIGLFPKALLSLFHAYVVAIHHQSGGCVDKLEVLSPILEIHAAHPQYPLPVPIKLLILMLVRTVSIEDCGRVEVSVQTVQSLTNWAVLKIYDDELMSKYVGHMLSLTFHLPGVDGARLRMLCAKKLRDILRDAAQHSRSRSHASIKARQASQIFKSAKAVYARRRRALSTPTTGSVGAAGAAGDGVAMASSESISSSTGDSDGGGGGGDDEDDDGVGSGDV